ncbi:hypothetical protein Taro_008444 [Colocasia esculenta]|uniref:Uncharacterized protein n=1 Tax=Colocasia esculenta TaxID=4460 RepID=A0A843U6Y9_COLES|nr:hypothetical protein [Colocasia esculenta]
MAICATVYLYLTTEYVDVYISKRHIPCRQTMATRGRRGVGPSRGDESAGGSQALAQQAQEQTGVPLPPPPPPVDYGALMQGLVHAMQTQAQTTAALQAQEAEMEVYLEEKRASLKRPASAFQRQDRKKKAPAFQQRADVPARVAAPTPGGGTFVEKPMKDYDAILGLDWLEEHYALMDCRRKLIIFWIPDKEEFVHPLPKSMSGKFVISALKAARTLSKGYSSFLASVVVSEDSKKVLSVEDIEVVRDFNCQSRELHSEY